MNNNYRLIASDLSSFTLNDELKMPIEVSDYVSSNNDKLLPILPMCALIEPDSEYNDTESDSLLMYLYWIDMGKELIFSDFKENAVIRVVDAESGIEVNVPLHSALKIIVDDNNYNEAIIDLPENSAFSIMNLYTSEDKKFLNNIKITGISNGIIQTTETNSGIYFTGASDILIEAEIDGKSFVNQITDISDKDLVHIFFALDDGALVVEIENNTYEYTITVSSDGSGVVAGGGIYNKNAIVTLTAMPNNGYTFEGWYESGMKIINAGSTYTFIVTASRTLEAKFRYTGGSDSGNMHPTIPSIENPTTQPSNENPLSLILSEEDTIPADSTVIETNPFSDVKETDWYYEDVLYAYANKLMIGTNKILCYLALILH